MRNYITRLATGLAVAALPVLALTAAGTASASVAPVRPAATAECNVGPNCTSPDVQNSSLVNELVLAHAGKKVIVTDADSSDPAQDWRYNLEGTVSDLFNGGIDPMFGLTPQDNRLYGSDEVYQLESAPYGAPSDRCLTDVKGKAVLAHCALAANQQFIAADFSQGVEAGITNAANPDEADFALSIPHADVGNHDALTAHGDNAQLTFNDVNSAGSLKQYWDDDQNNNGAPSDN